MKLLLLLLMLLPGLWACERSDSNKTEPAVEEAVEPSGPIKVEVKKTDDGYQLVRGGEPYFIKGAGLEYGDIQSFADHGGNTIRNWTTKSDRQTTQEILDQASEAGVAVALCLSVQAERWGFDYSDEAAVKKQLDELREEVLKYRDHPALLVWIIGNELNFDYTNPKVYDAVNDISKMIHELDPNHPTTTTVAGIGENVVEDIKTRASDLDFISFQVYGELFILHKFLEDFQFEDPFFVTEWGAIGHWEVGKTAWGAPIEATSTQKAETYAKGYREVLEPLHGQLIGSFAFLWGQKQERTPTWFGFFTESGEETETVDVMHHIWNDKWPDNRVPVVRGMTLDGKSAHENVTLNVGETYTAEVDVMDHDDDPLTFRWEIKPESETKQVGGDFEESIANLDGLIAEPAKASIELAAPEPGAYRLFVYAYDGNEHAAHANIPFLVQGEEQ